MIGSLISAGLGAFGGILGAKRKNKLVEKHQAMLNKQKQENQDWYDRKYNEDATQRADAQRLLSLTEESIKRRNRAAQGRAAVMGGTDESVEAEKEANSKVLADAASQIAAQSDQRKDAIEQQYMNNKNGIEQNKMELEGQKQSVLNAAIGGAAGGLGSMF